MLRPDRQHRLSPATQVARDCSGARTATRPWASSVMMRTLACLMCCLLVGIVRADHFETPKKDCIPGYMLCRDHPPSGAPPPPAPLGLAGSAVFSLLVANQAIVDDLRVHYGEGTAGASGTDNLENFQPVPAGEKLPPRVGHRKLLRGSWSTV